MEKNYDFFHRTLVKKVVRLASLLALKKPVNRPIGYDHPNNSSACALAEADFRSPSMRASSSRRSLRLSPSDAMFTAVESLSWDLVTT